jgi:hypothetical protein
MGNLIYLTTQKLFSVPLCHRPVLDVRFLVPTAVKIHVVVFWVVAPCNVVVGYQRFGGLYCLHLHGIRISYHNTQEQKYSTRVCVSLTHFPFRTIS